MTGYTSDPVWGYSFNMRMAAAYLGAPLPDVVIRMPVKEE